VFIRSYGTNGLPSSQPIVASTTSDAWQYQSQIAGNASGEIAVTWTDHQIGGTRQTLARRFSLGRPQPQSTSGGASAGNLRIQFGARIVESFTFAGSVPLIPVPSSLVAQGELIPSLTPQSMELNEQSQAAPALSYSPASSLAVAQQLATASIFSEYAREHAEDDSTIGMIASDSADFELIR
jgi:hypothetical protein